MVILISILAFIVDCIVVVVVVVMVSLIVHTGAFALFDDGA